MVPEDPQPATPLARPRRGMGGLMAILPFALLLLSSMKWPAGSEELPTHWSSTLPDDYTSASGFFVVALTISGLCAVLAALVALLSRAIPSTWSRWIVTGLAAVGAGAASAYALTAIATAQAGDPSTVGWTWPMLAIAVGLLWGLLTYLVHGRLIPTRQQVIDRVPERDRVVPVRDDAPVQWETVVGSSLLVGLAIFVWVVFVVVVVLMLADGAGWPAWLMGVLGLFGGAFALAWSKVVVRVDAAGLTIRSALLPWRLLQIPADQVVGVQLADLDPMQWGGVGLRMLPDRTALVVKGGPGIVVHRANGRRFAVEITEGPEVAAAGAEALRTNAGRTVAVG